MIGTNLDRLFTDEPGFRKPRTGRCHLCGRPCLEHPTIAHRGWALWAIAVRFITNR